MHDVTDVVVDPTETVGIQKPPRLTQDDITKDYEYTRGNLYSIIEKGQEAINGILEVAQDSDMPRAYEVAGQLIKTVGETTEKLIDLQAKVKELDKDDSMPDKVQNNLFVGSSTELQRLLKQNAQE